MSSHEDQGRQDSSLADNSTPALNLAALAISSVNSACTLYKLPPELRDAIFTIAIFNAMNSTKNGQFWNLCERNCDYSIKDGWEKSKLSALGVALIPERKLYQEVFGIHARSSLMILRHSECYPNLKPWPPLLRENIRKISIIPHKDKFSPEEPKPRNEAAEPDRARRMLNETAQLLSHVLTQIPCITRLKIAFDDRYNLFFATIIGRPLDKPPLNQEAFDILLPLFKSFLYKFKLDAIEMSHRSLFKIDGYNNVRYVGNFGSLRTALDDGLGAKDEIRGMPPGRCTKMLTWSGFKFDKNKFVDLKMIWKARERSHLLWEEPASDLQVASSK